MARWKMPRGRLTRDTGLHVVGVGGIVYEVANQGVERPTLLLILAAMAGLPVFIRADEKLQAPTPPTPPGSQAPPEPPQPVQSPGSAAP